MWDDKNKKIVFFKNCTVNINIENGYVETVFDDGSKCPAMPQLNKTTIFTAKDLGYEIDKEGCKLMTIHHEILHTFLCEKCGLEYSPTLWAVAHNFAESTLPLCYQHQEEAVVLSFQKYLNDRGLDPVIGEFEKVNNLKVRKIKPEALKILDLRD